MNRLPSRRFTWNIKSYFPWKRKFKVSSAVVVISTLRVNATQQVKSTTLNITVCWKIHSLSIWVINQQILFVYFNLSRSVPSRSWTLGNISCEDCVFLLALCITWNIPMLSISTLTRILTFKAPQLQIRHAFQPKSNYIFLISPWKHMWGTSNENLQYIISWRNKKNIMWIPLSYLKLWVPSTFAADDILIFFFLWFFRENVLTFHA